MVSQNDIVFRKIAKALIIMPIQRCVKGQGGALKCRHIGGSARHLVMAWMFLEPNITHVLNTQTPASQNSTTFLKTISFWDTLYKIIMYIISMFCLWSLL